MTTTQITGRQAKTPFKLGDISGGDYAQVDTDGTVTLAGDATAWDDLQGPASTGKIPTSSAPSWTTWDLGIGGGVAFQVLGFGVGEYQDFTYQSSHAMKLETILSDHIHWGIPSDDSGKKFKFQIDVAAAGVDEQFSVPAGSPYTFEVTLGASESGYHRLTDFTDDIPGVNTTVSTLYFVRLSRIAASSNEYGSDVFMLFHDAHYQVDSFGSGGEYIK